MKKIVVFSAMVFGSASLATIAKDSPQVDAENARYKTELDAAIRKLNGGHVERLTAIQKNLTAAGDLDGAVMVRDQIKAIAATPNSPDSMAESAVSDTARASGADTTHPPTADAARPPANAPGIPTGLTVFEGKWTLFSGNERRSVSFDKKGNFHSGMDAWGDVVCSRKGNTVIFPGHSFTIISRDLLQGIAKDGKSTGERMERLVEAPSSKTPFGETVK